MNKHGIVYLVGAGPGDEGLLTLRGAELLGRADVVIYDALVNQELLRFAAKGAEVVFGGKRAGEKGMSQEELNALLVAKAKAGKIVVRLKGGDPYLFGRGAEEAQKLARAGVRFEVVPGVSSFVAVPNYAGVPLTHRDYCSRVTIITGHEDPAREPTRIDWPHVGKCPGTIVIMMGTDRIGQIAATLIANGKPSTTPVAMVHWGTTGRQQSIHGTLETIAEVAKREQIGPPTVAVIGEVVNLREELNWFESKPLFGKRVVITRSREQSGPLRAKLQDLGADVLEIPTIRFEAPTRREDLVDALLELNAYDWLVFTSPNGVTRFFEYFFRQFHDMRDLGGARIAAVGPGTAARLRELHLQVDLVPAEAVGSQIAREFAKFESIDNLRICLLRAEVANADLPKALESLGAIVDDIACYKTVPETDDANGMAARFQTEGADWVLFTSASTVEQFHARFDLPKSLERCPRLRLASIGPETSKALENLGVKPSVEAREHTIEGLVNGLRAQALAKPKASASPTCV